MIFVSGIEDNLEKFLIAPRPTHIFGRAMALSGKTHRTIGSFFPLQYFLQDHVVAPVVTEVVNIEERIAFGLQQFVERGERVVEYVDVAELVVGEAVNGAVLLELVEVTVGPPHDNLEHLMKMTQTDICRNSTPPPNRRTDVAKCDLEPIRGWNKWLLSLALHACRIAKPICNNIRCH